MNPPLIFPLRTFVSLKKRKRSSHAERHFKFALVAGVLLDKGNTLGNVLLEIAQAGLDELLLVGVDLANGVDLLNTVGAELDVGAEELDALVLVQGRLDKGRLNDALLAVGSAEESIGHAGTSESHGEGGRAGTVLGLDDLVTTELDTVDELGVGGQVGVVALAEERNDGDTRVTADDGNLLVLGVGALDLGDEAASSDNVEGGDTEQLLGVVDTAGLEDLGADGHGGVDGVGDDEELGLGGGLGNSLGQVADDGGVGVEEIVTGHAGLTGDTSGNQDDVGALEGGSKAAWGGLIALDGGLGVDVGDVSGDTCEQARGKRRLAIDTFGEARNRMPEENWRKGERRGTYQVRHGYRTEQAQ